jgi:hypothetical protein
MSNGGSFEPSSGNISSSFDATTASSVSPYELSARSQCTLVPGARLAKIPAMKVPCPAAGSRTRLPSPSNTSGSWPARTDDTSSCAASAAEPVGSPEESTAAPAAAMSGHAPVSSTGTAQRVWGIATRCDRSSFDSPTAGRAVDRRGAST